MLTGYKKVIAALSVIAVIGLSTGLLEFNKKPYNVAYAVVKAYEQIERISGRLEYQDENGSKVSHSEIIDFKSKKPNKFIYEIDNGKEYYINTPPLQTGKKYLISDNFNMKMQR